MPPARALHLHLHFHRLLLPLLLLAAACGSNPAPTDAADVPVNGDAADRPSTMDAPAADAPGMDVSTDLAPVDVPAADVLPQFDPFRPTPRGSFPPGFLWGSATAPYQIEGGLPHTDWAAWERLGHVAHNDHADNGPRSFTNYLQDLDALVATHQNAYRLGIDWSRLFPTRAQWTACSTASASTFQTACRAAADPAGLAYYHAVLDAALARHLTPMVTLHHFVFPDYLEDPTMPPATQGFAQDAIVTDFASYARFVAGEYGRQVDYWITINEPFALVAGAYLQGVFPPGAAFDAALVLRVLHNMIYAHARAYDAIHSADTVTARATGDGGVGDAGAGPPALVSFASHNRVFRPARVGNAADVTAAAHLQYVNNLLFLNAVVRGDLDANGNGVLSDPGDLTNDPDLRARMDYVGVNYYGLTLVLAASIPLVGGLPELVNLPTPLPKNDLGWDIYPQGFIEVLHEANRYALPMIVTENGIADAQGVNRPRFIAEHLAAMAAAIQSGDHVVGYFHWSVIDNFEWAEGFCPHFGLYHVDYASPARTRSPAGGADTLRQIIDANQVTDALLAAQPAYAPPQPCHPQDGGT